MNRSRSVNGRDSRNSEGFTLLEVTFAVAIFVVAMGLAAQSLTSFSAQMRLQDERMVAANVCKSALSNMRELRDGTPADGDFHAVVTAVFPEGAEFAANTGWTMPGSTTPYVWDLRDSRVRVNYNAPPAGTNLLVPTISVEWKGLRGYMYVHSITTALADR